MDSEVDYCRSYIEEHPHEYEREVPVGNIVLRDDATLHEAASGPFAGSIDALFTPSDRGREQLVECKRTPGFRGLGQLLLYTYFRRRDREVVHEKYANRSSGWETTADRDKLDTHVRRTGAGSDRTFHPKPVLESIQQVLAVGEVAPSHGLLLSTFTDLGITVRHRTDGTWRTLDSTLFDSSAFDRPSRMESWLASKSRATLDSESEDALWEDFADIFGTDTTFKEVPVGSFLFSESRAPPRADVVVKTGDTWLIVEMKDSTNETARQDFQKGFGQAVGYASLFAREWELPRERVVPILIQNPLPVTAGVYRRDRYDDDHTAVMTAARESATEPAVLGVSLEFG